MNKAPDKQRKVLGKGLSALLPSKPAPHHDTPHPIDHSKRISNLAVDRIDPNPLQPRHVFDPAKIEELAASIRINGIIQPLIIRHKGDRYELVAGERRLRAAKLAGLTEVPAIVQDYADDHMLEIALIENIQREDLNPIETAQALDRLGRELNLSHEEIARHTGKDRSSVTNLLRLLRLPEPVQLLIAEGRISLGHAKVILGIAPAEIQIHMAQRAADLGFSVREVERILRDTARARDAVPKAAAAKPSDPNVTAAVRDLENALGTRVRIVESTNQKGRIEIEYYSQDDLNRIYDLLIVSNRADG